MKIQANRPFYHVRHDLQPHLAEELLILLWDRSPCHIEILQEVAAERGYRLANRSPVQLLASLGNLRIIGHREHGEIYLSDFGKLIAHTAKYNPYLVPELIHFTYYTLYDESTQSNRFSWAYRLVCDYLWSSGTTLINSHRLVTLVQEQAQQTFHDYKDYGISFSQNSVTGIVSWLEALDPPCVEQISSIGRSFARRPFCSSELLLLALEYVKATLGNPLAAQLQLSGEVRSAVARLCLVEEEALDDLLENASDTFGLVLRQTERGNWISLLGERSLFPLTLWFPSPASSSTDN